MKKTNRDQTRCAGADRIFGEVRRNEEGKCRTINNLKQLNNATGIMQVVRIGQDGWDI